MQAKYNKTSKECLKKCKFLYLNELKQLKINITVNC